MTISKLNGNLTSNIQGFNRNEALKPSPIQNRQQRGKFFSEQAEEKEISGYIATYPTQSRNNLTVAELRNKVDKLLEVLFNIINS